jgi:hypothetical protein
MIVKVHGANVLSDKNAIDITSAFRLQPGGTEGKP